MTNNRYYWLKLPKGFFKKAEVRVLEGLPNGKEYALFYLKLLCESTEHHGRLRLNDAIPYNEDMLASITNTNVDIVRSAMVALAELNMIEILDDGTLYMLAMEEMIGSETRDAERKRIKRHESRAIEATSSSVIETTSGQCPKMSENVLNCPTEIEIEIEKDLKEKNTKKKNPFRKPTVDEIKLYCQEKGFNIDADYFFDYYESKGWLIGKSPMKDWKRTVNNWQRNEDKQKKDNLVMPYPKYEKQDKNSKDLEEVKRNIMKMQEKTK